MKPFKLRRLLSTYLEDWIGFLWEKKKDQSQD